MLCRALLHQTYEPTAWWWEVKELWKAVDATVDGGISSDEVGQMVHQAITENVFWVLPNAECYFPIFDQEFADMKNAIRN